MTASTDNLTQQLASLTEHREKWLKRSLSLRSTTLSLLKNFERSFELFAEGGINMLEGPTSG